MMSRLVAHRGQKASFPENTLESIQAAIDCGATAVEFDVQMTADHVPVVCHDMNLFATAGVDISIAETKYTDLTGVSVGEPARFADKYQAVKIPSLRDMVGLLGAAEHVTGFVELKEESIDAFGAELFLQQVLVQLQPIQQQCVVIADNLPLLLGVKKQAALPIGWIIHRWDEADLEQAKLNAMDYLFIDYQLCREQAHDFGADQWEWVMYATSDPDTALDLFGKGVSFVETDDICSMLRQLPDYK